MKATEKSEGIENLLTAMTGRSRVESVENDICALCGKPATKFNDKLGEREYAISGMCQACQDTVWE